MNIYSVITIQSVFALECEVWNEWQFTRTSSVICCLNSNLIRNTFVMDYMPVV